MTQRTGIMLAYPVDWSRLSKDRFFTYVQPKLDGVRCKAIIEGGTVSLLSSQGNPLSEAVPHIWDWLHGVPDGTYDGELYVHGWSFQELVSVAKRTKNLHPEYSRVQYHMFDLVNSDSFGSRFFRLLDNYYSRVHKLVNPYSSQYPVEVVNTTLCHTENEIHEKVAEYISQGYEGAIFRNPAGLYVPKRTWDLMKYKPQKLDTYTICGWEEEVSISGEPKGSLGAFVCFSPSNQDTFRVGTGPVLTKDGRSRLWKDPSTLIGRKLVVKYQELTSDRKVPRFPVAMELV